MKKYKAMTLLELIVVMVIVFTLSIISVVSYRSLVDSFSINEVSLTIAQDIRGAQRAAMMLDRDSDERWLHGIGLDFTEFENTRKYDVFRWCSEHDYFDGSKTNLTGEVPNYDPGITSMDYLRLSANINETDVCERGEIGSSDAHRVVETKDFSDFDNLEFILNTDVVYILFESVSGKTFFYNYDGYLLNYYRLGGEIRLNDNVELFNLELEPMRGTGLSSRNVIVRPVSGMINFDSDDWNE